MLTIIFYVNILKARGIDFVAFDDLTVTYIGLLGACFIKPKIVNQKSLDGLSYTNCYLFTLNQF